MSIRSRLRDWLMAGAAPVAPEPVSEPLVVTAKPKRSSRKVEEAANRSKTKRLATTPNDPFKVSPTLHPPGVAVSPEMAMDDATTNNEINAWAFQNISAILADGQTFMGYPLLSELAQRPEYRRISETIARHCTRKWIEFDVKTDGAGAGGDKEERDEDNEDAAAEVDEDQEASAKAEAESDEDDNSPFAGGQDLAFGNGAPGEAAKEGSEPKPASASGEGPEAEADGDDDKSEKSLAPDQEKLDKVARIEERLEEIGAKAAFLKVTEQDGFFGRAHLYIDTGSTDEPDELKTSIGDGANEVSEVKLKNKAGVIDKLRPVEAVWCYPTNYNSNDPLKPDWYKPKSWFVMGKELDSSRLLTFIGREVPDILKPAYSFGGLAMSQMLRPYVENWLNTRQSVANIVRSFSVFVLKTQLTDALSENGNADVLFNRIALFNNFRENEGTFAIDKTDEDFANVSASLSGLDKLQAQAQEQMASIAGIPIVLLLMITPSGLNACLPGDTLVLTDRGEVPIRDVTLNDLVMTRRGWAPLTFSGVTKHAKDLVEIKTVAGRTLRCTDNHPIWITSTGEFVRAENVRPGDRLLLSTGESPDVQKTQSMSLGADTSGGSKSTAITHVGTENRNERFYSTERCGRSIAALFPMDFKSITETATGLTTGSKTLSQCLPTITPPITASTVTFEDRRVPSRYAALSAKSTSSFRSFQVVENFARVSAYSLAEEQLASYRQDGFISVPAGYVERHLQPIETTQNFALESAQPRVRTERNTSDGIFVSIPRNSSPESEMSEELRRANFQETVLGAEWALSLLDATMKSTAHNSVRIARDNEDTVKSVSFISADEPVYDLTVVKGHLPEFFAGGILVHNSSEGEIQAFWDWVHSYQESFIRPNLTTVINMIQMCEFGEIDPDITWTFSRLEGLNDLEWSQKELAQAQTDAAYCDAGIIEPIEVRKALAADTQSRYHGLDIDDVPEPPEPELPPGMAGMMPKTGAPGEPAKPGTPAAAKPPGAVPKPPAAKKEPAG